MRAKCAMMCRQKLVRRAWERGGRIVAASLAALCRNRSRTSSEGKRSGVGLIINAFAGKLIGGNALVAEAEVERRERKSNDAHGNLAPNSNSLAAIVVISREYHHRRGCRCPLGDGLKPSNSNEIVMSSR